MSSNKVARNQLIELYGAECFIDKLKLRKDKNKKYTGSKKKRKEILEYHHIIQKKDGGEATVENGALLKTSNHVWFHQQNDKKRAELNNAFQEYKKKSKECKVVFVEDLEQDYELRCFTMNLDKRRIYDRAKTKARTRKIINRVVYNER